MKRRKSRARKGGRRRYKDGRRDTKGETQEQMREDRRRERGITTFTVSTAGEKKSSQNKI